VKVPNVNDIHLYDAAGERVSDRDALAGSRTITIRGLDGHVLRSYVLSGTSGSGSLAWLRDEVYAGTALVASISAEPDEGTRFYALDHLGTPRLITSSCASTIDLHSYYPFGLQVPETPPVPLDNERTKFTGQERDLLGGTSSQTGHLDDMHARFYNPNILRFTRADFVSGDPHSPQSFNLFAYAGGNPMNFVDPFGFQDDFSLTYSAPQSKRRYVNLTETAGGSSQSRDMWLWLAFLFGGHDQLGSDGGGGDTLSGTQGKPCGTNGWLHGGLGFYAGGNADATLGPVIGAAGTLSGGVGAFYDPDTGLSSGAYATGGVLAFLLDNVKASPSQTVGGQQLQPGGLGAYAGGGAGVFFTNARSVNQLSGHFEVWQVNIGLGEVKFSLSIATAGNIGILTLGPPIPQISKGWGLSGTRYVTDTMASGSGCR
jgi:RHS repeat-associated protein